jgi:hypothetical protein
MFRGASRFLLRRHNRDDVSQNHDSSPSNDWIFRRQPKYLTWLPQMPTRGSAWLSANTGESGWFDDGVIVQYRHSCTSGGPGRGESDIVTAGEAQICPGVDQDE